MFVQFFVICVCGLSYFSALHSIRLSRYCTTKLYNHIYGSLLGMTFFGYNKNRITIFKSEENHLNDPYLSYFIYNLIIFVTFYFLIFFFLQNSAYHCLLIVQMLGSLNNKCANCQTNSLWCFYFYLVRKMIPLAKIRRF